MFLAVVHWMVADTAADYDVDQKEVMNTALRQRHATRPIKRATTAVTPPLEKISRPTESRWSWRTIRD
jgi:hypothetical protein